MKNQDMEAQYKNQYQNPMGPILSDEKKQQTHYVHIPVYDVRPIATHQEEIHSPKEEPVVQIDERWYAKSENYKPLTTAERPGFIKKVVGQYIQVYSIMIIQLLITVVACCFSYLCIPYRDFQVQNSGWVYLAIAIAIIIEIVLLWIPKYSWKVPHNYILLFIFTLCVSYIISQLCSYVFNIFNEDGGILNYQLGFIVLMAAALCLASVVGLNVYAFKMKKDFTTKGAFLFMASTSLFLFAILSGVYYDQAMRLVYALISSLLFGAYLIYDTQLIVGGKTHQLAIDDYIIASMFIYIDIVYLFANLVIILVACFR